MNNSPQTRSIFVRIGKIFLRIVVIVILLLIAIVFLIQTSFIQNFARGKIQSFLRSKLHTRVDIGHIAINYAGNVVIKNIFLEDKKGDTLFSGGQIRLDIALLALLHHSIDIKDINCDEISLKVKRVLPDTVFNYDFVLQAFGAKQKATEPTKDTSAGFAFSIKTIQLRKLDVVFQDDASGNDLSLRIDNCSASVKTIDPAHNAYAVKDVSVDGLYTRFRVYKPILIIEASKDSELQKEPAASIPLSLAIGNINFKNSREIQYDDQTKQPLAAGMDYSHLALDSLIIQAKNITIDSSGYGAAIGQVSFVEKRSHLSLHRLSADLRYSSHEAQLKDLVILTNQSSIKNQTAVRYSSTAVFSKDLGQVGADVSFSQSVIAARDLLLFVPALATPLKGKENTLIHLNGSIHGLVNDMSLSNVEIAGLSNTLIRVSGKIKGMPDAKKAFYDLQLSKLNTSRKDLAGILPSGTIPSTIRVPENLSLHGSFKGSLERFATALALQTSNGNANLSGSLNRLDKTYALKASTEELDLGSILEQQKTLGKCSLRAEVKGKGFDYKTMNTTMQFVLVSGSIKQYRYKNLKASASLENGNAQLTSSIEDPNISYSLRASGQLNHRYPSVKWDLLLDTLNPRALHLATDTMQVKLASTGDFNNVDPDALQGQLKIFDVALTQNERRLHTDTISFVAVHSDSAEQINFHAEMADLDLRGKYKLSEFGQELEQTLDQYYQLPMKIAPGGSHENWKMQLVMRPSPLVLQLMPSLRGSDSVQAAVDFNSQGKSLGISVVAPKIQSGNAVIEQFSLGAKTSDSSLSYQLNLLGARTAGFQVFRSSATGKIAHNEISTDLQFRDGRGKDRYQIAGTISQLNHAFKVSLSSDSLMLNYDKWTIDPGNYLQYNSDGLVAHNVNLHLKDESLSVNSTSSSPASPIDVAFNRFQIKTLTAFAGQDSLFVDGILNGKAQVSNVLNNPVFTADLQIDDLAYKKDTLGNLLVKVDNKTHNAFDAHLGLNGQNTQLKLDGTYYTGENKMNLTLAVAKLNLAMAKVFSAGQLKDIGGNMQGDLQVSGAIAAPVFTGALHFDSAFIVPLITGEKLRLSSDTVSFDNEGISFDQFSFLDSAGNKAILSGNVFTTDFKNYRFDLSLNASNFRLVNTPRQTNSLFFGKLNMDADIEVTGDLNAPKVNAGLRVNKKTDFTLILPSSDPEVVNREGVVVFVDKEHPIDTARLRTYLDSISRNSSLKGMEISSTIETDSNAQFTVIIDERNGDALSMRGRAELTGGIDKSGKSSLTGTYELDDGAYNLSLSVLKRKFKISRGSTVTWAGDPTKAKIDITATYIANTAPIDLVQQQLSGMTTEQTNKFKQKLPFMVNLHMVGDLLKPQISFTITLSEELLSQWPEVDNKLSQMKSDESEVNKQVFALLLLNRFVADNPFETAGGGTDANLIARQSVSSILSSQLNQLAGSLIKGVNLSFDVNSDQDYSSGQAVNQTELTVGISKSLFNDRIQVTVGNNFQLEGTNPGQNASNIAGDISVDYKLSKDGRYMLRAYNKNQYESIVEGQVVETGISFILTFDYNEFRDLFHKNKKSDDTKKAGTIKNNVSAKTDQ